MSVLGQINEPIGTYAALRSRAVNWMQVPNKPAYDVVEMCAGLAAFSACGLHLSARVERCIENIEQTFAGSSYWQQLFEKGGNKLEAELTSLTTQLVNATEVAGANYYKHWLTAYNYYLKNKLNTEQWEKGLPPALPKARTLDVLMVDV